MHIKFQSGNLKGRDHLVGYRHRWEDNIKMDIREIACRYGLDTSGLE
jgi:hypothetical protein